MKRLGTLVLILTACSSGPGADPGDPGGGKQDEVQNRLQITGSRNTTLQLDKAFQCEITQWAVLLGWHNHDLNSIDFSTFRATILAPLNAPLVEKQKLQLTDDDHRLIFDGRGHSSAKGGSCEVEVSQYRNDTRNAAIALKFRDCKMATSLGGSDTVLVSGEVSCSGAGFTPIVIDLPTPDAGVDAGVDAAPSTPETPDAQVPAVDPCGGRCGASQACVHAACVSRDLQVQSTFCDSPSAVCDAGEDADCAAGHVCVAGKCRRLTCQVQSTFCDSPTAICEGDDNTDCAEGHACVAGKCRRLSCQVQNNFCDSPGAVCDGNDNGDCGAGNVCVGGKCRNLGCQIQSTFCDSPRAPCDGEDSDCATGHTCTSGVCKRSTCP